MERTAEVEIRKATPEDVGALADIYQASADHHVRLDPSLYSTPDYLALKERYGKRLPLPENEEILVAEVNGEVVGWIELQLRPVSGQPRMMRDAVTAEIDVAVLPQHRGHGVGGRLMAAGERWASEQGAGLITMETHVANVDAIRFYQERHGFRTTGILMLKRPATDLPS
ncbi:MAG: GNAT family N-acetyltransferase [Candidatus Dormibacteraeota bacterium]|nr:GNAT family N-acetyltransferase [Candidatus Dormibacteraeota bacterium]